MSNNTVRPSSIEGIKRLAKSIKRERGITHTLSLDEAARQGAFQNFRHAQNVLSARGSTPRARHGQTVYITSYWRDRDGRSRGRETLKLVLSRPWAELVSRAELRRDVPPILSSTAIWSPIPNDKEIGREEAFYRRTDHRLPA